MTRIEEIKARLAKITPGWRLHNPGHAYTPSVLDQNGGMLLQSTSHGNMVADSTFAASAPDDVAYLLAEVKRLEQENRIQDAGGPKVSDSLRPAKIEDIVRFFVGEPVKVCLPALWLPFGMGGGEQVVLYSVASINRETGSVTLKPLEEKP